MWWALASAAAAVLLLAASLEPSMAGHGTHVALGLPACPLWSFYGVRCPACGLTTSFAWLARGQLAAAWTANPLGLPLFALTWACLPVSLWSWWRRRTVFEVAASLRADIALLLIAVAGVISWALRI